MFCLICFWFCDCIGVSFGFRVCCLRWFCLCVMLMFIFGSDRFAVLLLGCSADWLMIDYVGGIVLFSCLV